mgnify:CR=1 FL=1
MTYHSKRRQKESVLSILNFYKQLLKADRIKIGGSAYTRMTELQLRNGK